MYNLHYLLPDERRYVELLQKHYYDEISDAEREELERIETKLNASVEAQLERMQIAECARIATMAANAFLNNAAMAQQEKTTDV